MKKIVSLGLSVLISASMLLPANASACNHKYMTNSQRPQYKNTRVYCKNTYQNRNIDKSYLVKRINGYMSKVEEARKNGWISKEGYEMIKSFLDKKLAYLENMDNYTPKKQNKPIPKKDENVEDKKTENKETEDKKTEDKKTEDKKDNKKEDKKDNINQGLTAKEQQMVNLVNKERKNNGLKPLIVDIKLTKVARVKSQDMIDKNYFDHTSPTYGSPFDMMKKFGITFMAAGENIAGNQSVENAHVRLMNSPGHRRNILDPNYTHIGIGIKDGGKYGSMFTQMFIKK
ncbi:CAP domain-containing protein [Clostridiaceae bacterium M8S5]|nr:CAP domain-containing protein [Clostridiaceae bacterium M8S5]